jgi:hypothetical protein
MDTYCMSNSNCMIDIVIITVFNLLILCFITLNLAIVLLYY